MNAPDEHLYPKYISLDEYLSQKQILEDECRALSARKKFAEIEQKTATPGAIDYSRASAHTSNISRQPEYLNERVDTLQSMLDQKEAEKAALNAEFERTLELLPMDTERLIIHKRDVENMKWGPISEAFVCTPKTARNFYDAAVEHLSKLLEEING